MKMLLVFSTIFITIALACYSTGVWAERIARYLKRWHLVFFWTGFGFDVLGTFLMHLMADDPFNLLNFHVLTGQLAIWLMLLHAIWASRVVRKDQKELRLKFHRYSLFVWLIWLIPYFGGMLMGMQP